MATVVIKGGMGNQMFQYAFGKSLSKKNNIKIIYDTNYYLKNKTRKLELLNLNINEKEIENKKIFNNENINNFIKKITLRKIIKEENNLNFKKIEYEKNTIYDGYWQSEKYFKEIRNEIIKKFSLNKNNQKILNEKINCYKIQKNQTISIHIRRGDYLSNNSALEIHGLMQLGYYYESINKIINLKNYKDPNIIVFSDDIIWCKENIKLKYKTVFIEPSHQNSSIDLHLMSKCRDNIIANSTYSWWGAWLNESNHKVIVAPKKWFNSSIIINNDIYPKDWLTV